MNKSFNNLRRGADGKLILDTPEKSEIEKLKAEIEALREDVTLEKEAHLETISLLEQARRDIEKRDSRAPIGYLSKVTRTYSDNKYRDDDIAVYDKFDPFLHMSSRGGPEDAKSEKDRGGKKTALPRTSNDWRKQ